MDLKKDEGLPKNHDLILRYLNNSEYAYTFKAMQNFTAARTATTLDEFWIVEHAPVFTQGLAGKPEHILNPGAIPIIQTDRGGQITYHGPGQLVVYLLVDIKRKNMSIRALVCAIETAIINLLADDYHLKAHTLAHAPGVYIEGAKIAALGLRIRKGCSYHGLSFNLDMDLEPFNRINPCGYRHLKVVQLKEFVPSFSKVQLVQSLIEHLSRQLSYTHVKTFHTQEAHSFESSKSDPQQPSSSKATVLTDPQLRVELYG